MTSLPFFQVDAFAIRPLTGNPAAVIPLDRWLDDDVMQAIAAENNLSETAFAVPTSGGDTDFDLRWFTPTVEVDLCGHATLAAGHILMTGDTVRFASRSGVLTVSRDGDALLLDLPAAPVEQAPLPGLASALGLEDAQIFVGSGGNDHAIVLLDNEEQVRSIAPDFAALARFDRLVSVTAPGDAQDIASRVFAAAFGIDEDPVTGSAHAALTPFWAARLGRRTFTALQASKRGGHLGCTLNGDRVMLSGRCFTIIAGQFQF